MEYLADGRSHLRAADGQAAQTAVVDELGGEISLRTLKEPEPQPIQGSLFDGLEGFEDLAPVEEKPQDTVPLCIIYDWESNEPFEFAALKGGM